MSNVYMIADCHFGGENINLYERDFENSEEMDKYMIQCWNDVVSEGDIVFILGDFFDNLEPRYVKTIISKLNGIKTLIAGNHDTNFVLLESLGVEIYNYPIIYENFWMLSHEPLYVNVRMPYANIYGHIHNNPNYKDFSSRGFCVSADRIKYYPIEFNDIKTVVHNCK